MQRGKWSGLCQRTRQVDPRRRVPGLLGSQLGFGGQLGESEVLLQIRSHLRIDPRGGYRIRRVIWHLLMLE